MDVLFSSDEFSTETEESEKKDWSTLPLYPLEKIYSYLSRANQVNMSLVCRNWSKGYDSPSLWENFRFELNGKQLAMNTCPLIKFVLKYGNMFRHVEILHSVIINSNAWCRHLITFLQEITTNSQLTSVKFHGFVKCYPLLDTSTLDSVNKAIADFLGSQHHLKKLEFTYWFYDFGKGLELLKELNDNSWNSIEHLGLGGLSFCKPLEAKEQESNTVQKLLTLGGLESLTKALEIDYSLIFENKFACQSIDFRTLKNPQKLVLSKIIIDYDMFLTYIDFYNKLKSFDWLFLTKLYPDLQVELNISTILPSVKEMENLIVKNMPITRLDYSFEESTNNFTFLEIHELCYHLLVCKTYDHLVSLNLKWILPIPNLAKTFMRFLRACKKLKYLHLFIKPPVNGLCLLLESWLENRPKSLKEVLILIDATDDENDRMILKNSITEYVSRLESVGLNVKIELHKGS